jgi:predicted transposase/invertase (TIGR01784 family)
VAIDDKLSILDVKARDQLGRYFNAEMQMVASGVLPQRLLYYWGKLYTDQLPAGKNYALLRPTISVCFLDGVLFPETPRHHLVFRLIDRSEGITLTPDLTIHLLELPKFGLSADEVTTPLDAWLYFLRHAQRLDPEALPPSLDAPKIRDALEVLTMLSQADIDREIYEGRIKARRDQLMHEEAAAYARVKALAEGRADGIARGTLMGRIEFAQKLLRLPVTPRAELETMPMDALESLAARLEREAMG